MAYIIEDITKENINEWLIFLEAKKINNVFLNSDLTLILKNSKHYKSIGKIIRNSVDNKILTGYVFYISKEYIGKIKIFTRIIMNGSPIFDDNDLELNQFLISSIINSAKSKGIYIDIWHDRRINLNILEDNNFIHTGHYNIQIDLRQALDNVWNKIHKKRQINIKRYSKRIQIKEATNIDDLDSCYKILKDTYKRINLPLISKEVFFDLFEGNRCIVFMGLLDSEIIGTRFILKNEKVLYDWFAGDKTGFRNQHINDCLVWYILEYGIKNKYEVFDFGGGGSVNEDYGPRDFKLTFGGKLEELGRDRYITKPINYSVLKLVIKLRKTFLGNG